MQKTIKEIKAQKEAVVLLSKAIEIVHFSGLSQEVVNHLIRGLAMAEAESRESFPIVPKIYFTAEQYENFVRIGLANKPIQANDFSEMPPEKPINCGHNSNKES